MPAPAYPRPAPEFPGSFETYTVLPELIGVTVRELVTKSQGLRLWCRACGRDIRITPFGLVTLFPTLQARHVETVVRAARCQTCGAKEAQGSGWAPEPPASDRLVILAREHARGPRLDRPKGPGKA